MSSTNMKKTHLGKCEMYARVILEALVETEYEGAETQAEHVAVALSRVNDNDPLAREFWDEVRGLLDEGERDE